MRLLALSLSFALLQAPLFGAAPADPTDLSKRVVEHRLANGLTLLVLERHFSPTVSVRMTFRTGSVEEVSGLTGLAHMFEHMMFKGTRTVGTRNYVKEAPLLREIDQLNQRITSEKFLGAKASQDKISALIESLRKVESDAAALVSENEMWSLYEKEGASYLNASTSADCTQYSVDLPANKLELWSLLDSDRLKNPVFRQFYSEREVVKEERRMRIDTDPEGKLYENLLAQLFVANPYRNPIIGWEDDLNHLTVSDLESFYRQYYTPERLTIAVVGDVSAAHVIDLVERNFGDWRSSAAGREHPKTAEPLQAGPRRLEVRFDAQPQCILAFHTKAWPDVNYAATEAISQLLAGGVTSRLYKSLVEKKKLATRVSTWTGFPGERYDSAMVIHAAPRFPHTSDQIYTAIWQEINKLKKQPVESWELEKIRAAVAMNLLNALQTNSGMANALSYNNAIFGDWRTIISFQKDIEALTPADLSRAANQIFVENNQTFAVIVPEEKVKKR